MVSVSRRGGCRRTSGSVHSRNASLLASGLPLPSGTRSSGSTTGSCSSGTGCTPQVAQWISGIGQPQ